MWPPVDTHTIASCIAQPHVLQKHIMHCKTTTICKDMHTMASCITQTPPSADDGVCMVHEAMVCVYLQMVVFVWYMVPLCVCASTDDSMCVIHDALVCVSTSVGVFVIHDGGVYVTHDALVYVCVQTLVDPSSLTLQHSVQTSLLNVLTIQRSVSAAFVHLRHHFTLPYSCLLSRSVTVSDIHHTSECVSLKYRHPVWQITQVWFCPVPLTGQWYK